MAKERALLRTPLAMLCNSCHRQEEEWARPLQHLPFERGKCLDCHLPHASAWPGLTKQGQVVLCYSCHYDRKGELKRPVKHDPYGRGRCTDCHEPHSAAAANLLPTASEEEFCLSCHQKIIDVGWHGSPHARLFDERTCLACHEHHAAGFRYLSRFPLDGRGNLCLFCHDRIGRYYYLSAHAFLRCGQCHQIHGSLYPHLLDAFELDLCNRCHTGMVHRSTNHPVGEPYRDQLRGRVLLCSSCHGPHGTRYAKMKLRHGNDLCLPCHDQIY
jgi:predicted CXXCH cytochrome family protein